MEIAQAPAPEQAPLHPAKLDPAAAVAIKLILVPLAKFALHVTGQLMPVGVLVIEPEPLPDKLTDSRKVTVLKVAVTDCGAFILTLQAPVPEHAPLHPAKVDPAAAAAVKVTVVPLLKFALHVTVQLIPEGALVTEPEPLPATVTDSWKLEVTVLKVAVTDCAAFILTLQAPVPEHAPLHPAKVDPAFAVAVKATVVPLLKFALHVTVQLIPEGALVTEPEPLPDKATNSGKVTVLNVAVTDCAAFMVTLQAPAPVQAPLQPAKVEPAAAVAVNVTTVPLVKFALQAPGQLMPAGLLLTVPLGVPVRVTVRGKLLVPFVQFGNLKLAIRVFQL
jgi:hypothetical protein